MLLHEILSSLDIHLLAFGRYRADHTWNYTQVNSYYNRLLLLLDGSAVISHHGRTYPLHPGQIHLIPCYTSADYSAAACGFETYYLHFTSRAFGGLDICRIQEYEYQLPAREVDRFFFDQLHRLNPTRELPVTDPSIHLYRKYHDESQQTYHAISPQLHLENQAYISLLLAPFLATGIGAAASRVESRRMYDFASFIESNLHRPIGLKEVADALDVHPTYLSDWLFKRLRIRPIEYINRRKIEEAQLLLISTDETIKQIANRLGFSSASYFSRVFKKQIGLSASRYRAIHS